MLLRFDFDGELVTTRRSSPDRQVRAQLLYLIGLANGLPGGARLDHLRLTNVILDPLPGDRYRIRYHAQLPIAWGSEKRWPPTFPLPLPRQIDARSQQAFVQRYGKTCIDPEDAGHQPNTRNFWFYYRPAATGCSMSSEDTATFQAKVSVSPEHAADQYPDYERIWADRALDVVAIFSKYSRAGGATDEGVASFNRFVAGVASALPGATVTPADLGASPAPKQRDITFQQRLPGGRSASVTVLLVDGLESVPPRFEDRYAELTPGADLIVYSGHAGLGKNIRRLSEMGQFFPGKYQIVMLDGCDTFAYGDGVLIERRLDLNPDDPDGSKYLDLLTNALPGFFETDTSAPLALIRALIDPASARTYVEAFAKADLDSILMIAGGRPTRPGPPDEGPWNGFELTGTLKRGQQVVRSTPFLRPGRYAVAMTPDPAFTGGSAELRVRVGSAPPARPAYRCPSYGAYSNALCTVSLDEEAPIFVRLTGIARETRYVLRVYRKP